MVGNTVWGCGGYKENGATLDDEVGYVTGDDVWWCMNNVGNTNLPLSNAHENKTKYVHKIGWWCEGQKICLYTGGNGPSSLFRVEGCFWIIHDSSRHCLDVWGQLSIIWALFQWTGWPVLQTWSARADVLVFLSLTARWCSFNLCPRVLPVWPM